MDHARNRISPLNELSADLHLHSTASDGACAPSEVVRLAARAGLRVIALTDHDTVAGWHEASAAAASLGVRVMPATELSVRASWGEMHLLAYGFNAEDPALLEFMARATADRRDRAQAMAAALARLGIPVGFSDIEREAAGAPIGRPHVARALIAKKIVRSLDEAFDRFLGRGRPAYMPKSLPAIEAATDTVRAAGGIASAAHLKDRGTSEAIRTLKEKGVDAIEVRHPSHSPTVRRTIEGIVKELGLLPTGGSDWHGETSVGPSHGTIGAERVPDDWVAAIDAATRGGGSGT